VYGFGRSQAQKAVQAARNAGKRLTSASGDGTMKSKNADAEKERQRMENA
jgi:hypothetical protein